MDEETRNRRASEYLQRKEAQREFRQFLISLLIGIVTAIMFILLYFKLGY